MLNSPQRITPKNYDTWSFGKTTHMLTHGIEYRTRSTPHSVIKSVECATNFVTADVMRNGGASCFVTNAKALENDDSFRDIEEKKQEAES